MNGKKFLFLSSPSRKLTDRAFANEGLGGSENTIVLWARELAKRGYVVDVFSNDNERESVDGVNYAPLNEFLPSKKNYDVLISFRDPKMLPARRVAKFQVLFVGDRVIKHADLVNPGNCDLIWYVSLTQRDKLAHHFDQEILSRIGSCGVDDSLLDRQWQPTKNSFIHASSPYRGLKRLMDIWRIIRKHLPDAELHVTGGYELWGYSSGQADLMLSQDLQGTSIADGVVMHGPVRREEYLSIVERSEFFLYPTAYEEMCCIAALEAIAVGVVPLVSNVAALGERVHHGVNGLHFQPYATNEEIAQVVTRLAADDQCKSYYSRNGRRIVRNYKISDIVDELLASLSLH